MKAGLEGREFSVERGGERGCRPVLPAGVGSWAAPESLPCVSGALFLWGPLPLLWLYPLTPFRNGTQAAGQEARRKVGTCHPGHTLQQTLTSQSARTSSLRTDVPGSPGPWVKCPKVTPAR